MATNNAINAPIPFSVANGGTGQSSLTNHGILLGQAAANILPVVLTNGQMLIGSTGADPVAATISGGTGITVTTGAGTLTIASTGVGTWVDQTTSSVTMTVDTGYTADAGASLITFTLPPTSAVGDYVEINGFATGLYTIAQAAGQSIRVGASTSTVGVGGSVSSILVSDCIRLRCVVANLTWTVVSSQGNFTVV